MLVIGNSKANQALLIPYYTYIDGVFDEFVMELIPNGYTASFISAVSNEADVISNGIGSIADKTIQQPCNPSHRNKKL